MLRHNRELQTHLFPFKYNENCYCILQHGGIKEQHIGFSPLIKFPNVTDFFGDILVGGGKLSN